jgi:hypothetical protein
MAVTVERAAEPSESAAPADEGVQPYRWTRRKYEQLVEQGILGPGDRVQLVEGK